MNILYVAYLDMKEQTGLVRHMTELTHQLEKLGHCVTLCVPGIGRYQGRLALNIQYVPVLRRRPWQALSYHCLSFFFLWRLASRQKPDLLYCNLINFSIIPWMVAKFLKIRFVSEVSGLAGPELKANRGWPTVMTALAEKIQYWNIRHSRGIVTISEGLEKQFLRFNIPVFLLEMAADTKEFRPRDKVECRRQLGIPLDRLIIGYIGGFFAWHGLDRVLDAAAPLTRSLPDVLFLLVGDGPVKTSCLKKVQDLGLSPQVHFAGAAPLDQSPRWVSCFDVGIILFEPVREDPGSPIKLYEYMAAGIPVLASCVKGYGPVLERYQSGKSVADHRPETLAQALSEMLSKPQDLKTFGAHGRQAAVAHHSWSRNAQELEKFLKELS